MVEHKLNVLFERATAEKENLDIWHIVRLFSISPTLQVMQSQQITVLKSHLQFEINTLYVSSLDVVNSYIKYP
jgi:hypothetical protein